MKTVIACALALGLAMTASPAALAKAKKGKAASQPACLNALACGPQPVQQIRKPKNERFMKSAS